MSKMTQRILGLLRVMHANVPLRVLPNGAAFLDVTKVPKGIGQSTVAKLEEDGLIVRVPRTDRYEITELGRDAVRVHDGVDELIDAATTTEQAS